MIKKIEGFPSMYILFYLYSEFLYQHKTRTMEISECKGKGRGTLYMATMDDGHYVSFYKPRNFKGNINDNAEICIWSQSLNFKQSSTLKPVMSVGIHYIDGCYNYCMYDGFALHTQVDGNTNGYVQHLPDLKHNPQIYKVPLHFDHASKLMLNESQLLNSDSKAADNSYNKNFLHILNEGKDILNEYIRMN